MGFRVEFLCLALCLFTKNAFAVRVDIHRAFDVVLGGIQRIKEIGINAPPVP